MLGLGRLVGLVARVLLLLDQPVDVRRGFLQCRQRIRLLLLSPGDHLIQAFAHLIQLFQCLSLRLDCLGGGTLAQSFLGMSHCLCGRRHLLG